MWVQPGLAIACADILQLAICIEGGGAFVWRWQIRKTGWIDFSSLRDIAGSTVLRHGVALANAKYPSHGDDRAAS